LILIETAKANGLKPYWYLKHLFEHLPEAMTGDDFKALLPYKIEKNQLLGPSDTPAQSRVKLKHRLRYIEFWLGI